MKIFYSHSGPRTKEPISAIASSGDLTFAASGPRIHVFKRAQHLDDLEVPSRVFTISQLVVLGEYLFAVCDDNVVRIWNVSSLCKCF
jgi:U3 small nucleolar RNA-associated protein 21